MHSFALQTGNWLSAQSLKLCFYFVKPMNSVVFVSFSTKMLQRFCFSRQLFFTRRARALEGDLYQSSTSPRAHRRANDTGRPTDRPTGTEPSDLPPLKARDGRTRRPTIVYRNVTSLTSLFHRTPVMYLTAFTDELRKLVFCICVVT